MHGSGVNLVIKLRAKQCVLAMLHTKNLCLSTWQRSSFVTEVPWFVVIDGTKRLGGGERWRSPTPTHTGAQEETSATVDTSAPKHTRCLPRNANTQARPHRDRPKEEETRRQSVAIATNNNARDIEDCSKEKKHGSKAIYT